MSSRNHKPSESRRDEERRTGFAMERYGCTRVPAYRIRSPVTTCRSRGPDCGSGARSSRNQAERRTTERVYMFLHSSPHRTCSALSSSNRILPPTLKRLKMGILSVFRRKPGSNSTSNGTGSNGFQGSRPDGDQANNNEHDMDASDEKDDVAHEIMAEHLWTAAAVAGLFDGVAGLHVVSLRKSKNVYV